MENLLHILWALLFQSYHLEKLLVVERFSCYRRWKARELLRKIIETYTNTYPWFSSVLLRVLPWESQLSPAVVGAGCMHCIHPCFTETKWNKRRGRGAVSPFCRWRAELQRDGDLPKVTQEVCDRVGSWSLTCLVSFQCLKPFFFLNFYTKTVVWERTLTIRSLSLFGISTPGKKARSCSTMKPGSDEKCRRAHGCFNSVSFFLKSY